MTIDPKDYLGRAPERLTVKEQRELRGWWIALELYSPATTPLRRIEAQMCALLERVKPGAQVGSAAH